MILSYINLSQPLPFRQALELRFDALKLLAARRRPWPRPASAEKVGESLGKWGNPWEIPGKIGNMLKYCNRLNIKF